MQINDAMVAKAHAEYHKVLGDKNRSDPMRAALSAALAEMWRPIEEAPDNRPAMYGYRTSLGEWYQNRFEYPIVPQEIGYTHYAELLPAPPMGK